MDADTRSEILRLIDQMKRESVCPAKWDRLALEGISQDIEPIVMAQGLKYWMDLAAAL